MCRRIIWEFVKNSSSTCKDHIFRPSDYPTLKATWRWKVTLSAGFLSCCTFTVYASHVKLLVSSFPGYTVLTGLVSLTSGSSLHMLFFCLGYPPCFVPTPPKRIHFCALLYMCTELFLPVSACLTPNMPFGMPMSVTLNHLGLFLYAL